MYKSYGGDSHEMVPGRLIGYREWEVVAVRDGERGWLSRSFSIEFDNNAEYVLAPISRPGMWPWTNSYTATCGRSRFSEIKEHVAPHLGCRCGIYAHHTVDTLRCIHTIRCVQMGGLCHENPRIMGAIQVWGKVEIGALGFRAQFAKIVGIVRARCLFPTWMTTQFNGHRNHTGCDHSQLIYDALCKRYTAISFSSLDELVSAYPPVDVRNLLDD